MKITGWTDWNDERYSDDIPDHIFEEIKELVAKELRDNGYKFDGYYHQNGDHGVPVIDETWKFAVSFRSWGHMMIRAYPDKIDNSDGYGYTAWAWDAPTGETMEIPYAT